MSDALKVFVGFDGRELAAYQVCVESLRRHASVPLEIRPLILEHLRWQGLYQRAHEVRDGVLWDVISDAPMSTEFALTRFLVPALADWKGWALFCDCDFLFRGDVAQLFALADPAYAVQVVQHNHRPAEGVKMDGKPQLAYERKNWSSLMLWNCAHPHHAGQQDRVNRWRGLMLHQFQWLRDEQIGALPEEWNWLERRIHAVHFTRGTPDMPGYEAAEFSQEWRDTLVTATQGAPRADALQKVAA